MTDRMEEIKRKVIERLERAVTEGGPDRMDVEEVGALADIVKDLSESAKECNEAEYYKSVTDAMAYGYTPEDMPMRTIGYTDTSRQPQRQPGYRDGMGRYRQQGNGYYGGYGYDMQGLRDAMGSATPEERERMQREMRAMLGM